MSEDSVQTRFEYTWYPLGKDNPGPLFYFSVFDQCANDDEMRERWISIIGWLRPWIVWKPHNKTLEIGFEHCGVIYSVFIE
jgi:hypothetical protein